MLPPKIDETCALIRHTFKITHEGALDLQGRSRKSMISAGALHPIEPIIVSGSGVESPILYDDLRDAFVTIEVAERGEFETFVANAQDVVPEANGHLLLLVGDLSHVGQVYENPLSLLWRDAGAALQMLALNATAFNLGFVPLGLTGEAIMASLIKPSSTHQAVGLAIVGKPVG